MEFNQLPEDYDAEKLGPQKRRTKFDSPEEKLAYDAANLIEIARKCLEERRYVPNDSIMMCIEGLVYTRRRDYGSALPSEERSLFEEIRDQLLKTCLERPEVELDPRLVTFKADYDADLQLKSGISWTEIQNRLLVDDCHYLKLAQAMEGGGILFGVDNDGNPLIADRGDEPIMKGMHYSEAVNFVEFVRGVDCFRAHKDGEFLRTGYELFGYRKPYDMSNEMAQYEDHTGGPFVRSLDGKSRCKSWLKAQGDEGKNLRFACFYPETNSCEVTFDGIHDCPSGGCGVRRLLRVGKAA